MCFKREGAISTLGGRPQKLVDKFIYLGSNISSTENDVNTCLAKTWPAINRLSSIWMSDQSNKIKQDFFQAVAISTLQNGCITWTQIKCIEKKLDANDKNSTSYFE